MVEKFPKRVDPHELTDKQREFVDSVHIGLTLEDHGQYKIEREVNHTVQPSEFEDSQNATISRIMEASPEENASLIRQDGQPLNAPRGITKLDVDISDLTLKDHPETFNTYRERPQQPEDVPLYPAGPKTPLEREQERRTKAAAAQKTGFLSKLSKLFGG